MDGLLIALEASAPARALKASFYVYPLVNAAHVAAVGVLFTAVMVMHARAAGMLAQLEPAAVERSFRRIAAGSFLLAAITGTALFLVNAVEYAGNPAFQLKLVLLALAGLNLAAHLASARWKAPGTIASALLWLGVLVAGRFIGFV